MKNENKSHTAKEMFLAFNFTFIGFAFAIFLGLAGAWLAGHSGAFIGIGIGIGIGLGVSFLATAYIAGR